jgi:aminoglycoside phosphotransferase (APT) family kinase protein
VGRWEKQYAMYRHRDLPDFDIVARWLEANRPPEGEPGILHGDFHVDNCLFTREAPVRLLAIIDWEMGTIGDPKLDLAWIVQVWPDEGQQPPSDLYYDIAGMPSRTELLEYFEQVSGRQVDDMDYYMILARWKLAIVLEQTWKAVADGKIPREGMEAFQHVPLTTMSRAAELVNTTDYR